MLMCRDHVWPSEKQKEQRKTTMTKATILSIEQIRLSDKIYSQMLLIIGKPDTVQQIGHQKNVTGETISNW